MTVWMIANSCLFKRSTTQQNVTFTVPSTSASSGTLQAIHRILLYSVKRCLYQLFSKHALLHLCQGGGGGAEQCMLTVPPVTWIMSRLRLSAGSTQGLTLTGVHGKSGNAAATARAPASFVHSDRPTKNSRPRNTQENVILSNYLHRCLLYTNICTNKQCKFILNYCDMFRCQYTVFREFTGYVGYSYELLKWQNTI